MGKKLIFLCLQNASKHICALLLYLQSICKIDLVKEKQNQIHTPTPSGEAIQQKQLVMLSISIDKKFFL